MLTEILLLGIGIPGIIFAFYGFAWWLDERRWRRSEGHEFGCHCDDCDLVRNL